MPAITFGGGPPMPTENRNRLYDQISTREAEIAARCARLMTAAEIADELEIGKSTVDDHIRNIYALLDGHSWRDVARWWSDEKDAYVARLLERLLFDDAS